MGMKTDEKLIVNGKRMDGRKPEDIREMEMRVGVIPNATGSAYVRFGNTIAIAGVYGPREMFPRRLRKPDKATVQCRYNMAPFSVEDRIRPGPSRREVEISKVTRLALKPALFLENFPEAAVDVYIEILQADGSTRVAGINAASLALADAGVPMRDLVVALAGGKVDGTLIIDVCGKEDNYCDADVPIAFMPRSGKITLLQEDGSLTPEEFKQLVKNALEAGKKVQKAQEKALRDKYKV